MNFYNPDADVSKHGDALPHWEQGPAMQFVTIRLGDSLPATLIDDWRAELDAWLLENPKPWTSDTQAEYHRRFSRKIERWLDQGMGSCVFADADAREVLKNCLIRDWDHCQNVVRYIRRNPLKAKLPERSFTLWESARVSRL